MLGLTQDVLKNISKMTKSAIAHQSTHWNVLPKNMF